MQYPMFVTVAEACRLLSLGRTSIFARINDGSLTVAKMGRGTRITLSSVIRYSMACLDKRNQVANSDSSPARHSDVTLSTIADELCSRLCNNHSAAAHLAETGPNPSHPGEPAEWKKISPPKNYGGDVQ